MERRQLAKHARDCKYHGHPPESESDEHDSFQSLGRGTALRVSLCTDHRRTCTDHRRHLRGTSGGLFRLE